jgi:DNA polymerase I
VSRLLIVDGHAYAYRAFHAIRELTGPDGHPTNAIYGFIKMLEKLRANLQPSHCLVVWDGGLSTVRQALCPEYKAQRPAMPESLAGQLDALVEYLAAVKVASCCRTGVEADDLIASVANQVAANGVDVVIASSDKDFMQLVSARIGLVNPNDKTGAIWTREQVLAKAGVEPGQIVDWLALMGDAVDNISGVPGVGPKTAADLLNRFGSLSEILNHLDEVKSERLRLLLQESASVLRRNVQMIQLHDVDAGLSWEQLAVRSPDVQKLKDLYQRWGFREMMRSLAGVGTEQQAELI